MVIYIFCDIFNCDTFYTAYCVCKVLINDFLADTNCLKNLRTLIGLQCGNTHLRCDLYDTVKYCVIVIIYCCIVIFL